MSKVSSQYGKGVEICVSWQRSSGGQIPHGAVKAGGNVYVGRAQHNNEYVPGKMAEGHKDLYISYGGKEIPKSNYEILVHSSSLQHEGVQWKHTSGNNLPKGAIVGGSDNGQPLYIARSDVSGDVCVGKFFPPNGASYFPYGGKEHHKDSAEILCCVDHRA